ncbi:hypothetical protein JOE63_002592 [Cellulosimicrobium cellulans]|nr:hypothetical protein [Cellulosimicrobium cellulans]
MSKMPMAQTARTLIAELRVTWSSTRRHHTTVA